MRKACVVVVASVIPLKDALFRGVMMLFYGIGHSLLILAAGTSAGAAKHLIGSAKMHSANRFVKRAAGALLASVGLYIWVGAALPGLGIGL